MLESLHQQKKNLKEGEESLGVKYQRLSKKKHKDE